MTGGQKPKEGAGISRRQLEIHGKKKFAFFFFEMPNYCVLYFFKFISGLVIQHT